MTTQTQEVSSAFAQIDALKLEQRDSAYEGARLRIAGDAPMQETYLQNAYQKHSPRLVKTITVMADAVMFSAFVPSALRIFVAAFSMFAMGVQSFEMALIVGVTSVMLAEIGQVVFMLARATSDEGKNALTIGAVICTAYALIGNAHVAQPWMHGNLFAWLETFAPPVLVLIAAHVRKTQFLNADEMRHHARQEYETALSKWRDDFQNADSHALWDRTLANALWDALRNANKSKKAVLRDLTSFDKRMLVLRERSSEEWWDVVEEQVRVEEAHHARSAATGSGERTGETDGHVHFKNDAYEAECPYCHDKFVRDTEKGATNALSAHVGRWCKVRNAPLQVSANGHGELP